MSYLYSPGAFGSGLGRLLRFSSGGAGARICDY